MRHKQTRVTNSTVVDDAIRFVTERSREIAKKPKSSSYASSTENIKNPKNLVITMKKEEKNKQAK